MRATLTHIAEAMVLRFVPGVLNLFVLISLAAWMSDKTYGLVSTYIATSMALASLLFGHVTFSALAMHSEYAAKGEQSRFEQHVVAVSIVLASLFGAAALALSVAGVAVWPVVLATGTYAAYTAIQEILHARVQFVRFAVASTAQSATFLLLAFVWVRPAPAIAPALAAFAVSYGLGALASALLARVPPGRFSSDIFRESFRVGFPITLSTAAFDAFALGCRYLLIIFNAFSALGVFSFSLDLAQRTVGIFVNAAAFGIVARSFKSVAADNLVELSKMLWRGAVLAIGVALVGLLAVLLIGLADWVKALETTIYDPVSLIIVSAAIVAHRTGKMVVSPLAMRLRRTGIVLTGFLIAAPIALIFAGVGIASGMPYAVELGYAVAFGLWLAIGEFMVRRALFDARGEETSATEAGPLAPPVPPDNGTG